MEVRTTRIQVIRFKQQGYTLYTGTMTVGQLMQHAITTEWDPGQGWSIEGQGYQRAPIPEHYRRIAAFLHREQDPLLPTSALLASRNTEYGELDFEEVSGDSGCLIVPDERLLFVIDYQHRWRAFLHAIEEMEQDNLRDVTIPVTILSDTPLTEEVKQFYLINNKQRRINTDLALTLMQAMSSEATEEELYNLVGPGNRYQIRATRLVVRIAQQGSGPWAGKIQEPNLSNVPNQIATLKSFVQSLRPIVSTRSQVRELSDDALVNLLNMIWSGVLALHDEWSSSPTQFAIQRSVGLFVIHRVTNLLLIPNMLDSGDISSRTITDTLETAVTRMSPTFWRTGGPVGAYSSGAGQQQLAKEIINEIRTGDPYAD